MTAKEKHAIHTVVELIDRRIEWLKTNESNAKKEILAFWNASALILELEFLELN